MFALTVCKNKERKKEIRQSQIKTENGRKTARIGLSRSFRFLSCALQISWFLPSFQTVPRGCRPMQQSFESLESIINLPCDQTVIHCSSRSVFRLGLYCVR
jgi:hypothetical protein